MQPEKIVPLNIACLGWKWKGMNPDLDMYISNVIADEKVTGGSVKLSLKYGFLPVYDHTFDLCNLLTEVHKTCPIQQGITTISVETQELPTDIPKVS